MSKQNAFTNLVHGIGDDELDSAFEARPRTRQSRTVRRPAKKSARRRNMDAVNKFMFGLFLFAVAVGFCVGMMNLSFVSQNRQEIQRLRDELDELASQKQNLEVRMSLQLNMDRIQDEAINRLGMVYPSAEQVRVVSVGGTHEGAVTANAGADEGGQE